MGRPIGVVSLTDVSRVLAESAGIQTTGYPRRVSVAAKTDL